MDVKVEDLDGIKVLRLHGEFTGEDDDLIETFTDLLGTPQARIVLDLSAVGYLNSAGLAELVRMVGQANVQEARVILAGATPFVSGIFSTTRLDRFFDLAPSVEDAVRKLS